MRTSYGKQEKIRLKTVMLIRGLALKDLAALIGHDKSTVSKAINHGRYPRVLAKVRKELLGE